MPWQVGGYTTEGEKAIRSGQFRDRLARPAA